MSELSDMIKNWNTDILKDEDRVYDSKNDINRLIKVIPLLGEGIIQMKTSTRNLMINGLPLDGKLYKGTGSDTSGIVEVVPEGTDYVYHMAKSGTTQGAWSIKSTDTTSISQIPYVSEDVLFTNTLIKGSGTATLQFLDKDGNVLSEMTTPALTDTYQAFNVKGQLKDSVWSFKIVASDTIYFKQVMITRSSFPSDYMLSEEELEQLDIINTSGIDANTVTKSHAYQVIGLKNCPDNVSTSGLFITIQKDNFVQVFVPNDDTGIYYRVGVTTNRPNTKWTRLATSDNTYSKEDFTEMRTSDNINLIQDSSMSAGFWEYSKDKASTSSGDIDVSRGVAHITGNGTSGASWAQYQVTNQDYNQPLLQNSEIQYDQEYTISVETSWSESSDIASNDSVPPSLIARENYKDGTSKDLIHVKAVDKYGYNKWHKMSGTFKFSEDRKNDISFIQVVLLWKGIKGDVYFRRPKLERASLPSAYIDDTVVNVEPNHNLLQDSRDLLDGWQRVGSKVILDTTGDRIRYQGMRVQHQFGDGSYYGTTKIPVLGNGKYYTVSAYIRGLSEADINVYATILSDKSNSHVINFPLARHLTGDWRRYSYTFKFDTNTQVVNTSAIRVEGQGDWASNGGSVYVAGIKLEEGKTATDWSPSIEETIVRYETQNWQKDKITADDGGLALRINVSGTDPMDKQFLSATGTKTFYLQDGATGNNTGGSLRGILIKDSPSFGNAYAINDKNELWFLSIQDSKLTTWSKASKDAEFAELAVKVDGLLNKQFTIDNNYQASDEVAPLFKDEIKRVANQIDPAKFNFVVNTDTHYQERTTYGRFMNAPKTQHLGMRHFSNALALAQNADALILGGDNNHPDYLNIDVGKKDIQITASKILDNDTNGDRFMVMGNHDVGDSLILFNGIGKVKLDEIISEAEMKQYYRTDDSQFGEVRNGDSLYFYKDYPAKKIRLIGIETEDTQEITDSDGYIKYIRMRTHVIAQEQMNWIANTALMTTPSDYHVVMFGHAFLMEDTVNGEADKMWNYGILGDVINAWKKGLAYTGSSNITDYKINISADYTKRGIGQFVGYFCGHEHTETMYDFHGFKVVKLLHSLCLPGPKNEVRQADTLTEDANSLVSVDKANRTVNIIGFGASHDRQFSY